MQCPNDAATLVMSERSGIEIDYCPECRGIWLDRGELDKLIDRAQQQGLGGAEQQQFAQQPYEPQQPHGQQPYGQPMHGQQQPYGQQSHGQEQPGQQGSSDTVGRIADKVIRTVQQRAGQQGGQRGNQRGGRNWLGDILR
ncbi:TFIIB-type zinc ribbon-containing protein [Agrococcus sp. Marseille-P2731]|uniref:TFIIB-type zinc ribbon-containing protein n=1 Tax=Agrococcus sp. Marseille-P2731 TaxID=1841862 RepID=UPI0009F9C346|nr:zf-TFIIB domain-containing protein [Agrococcus sp. Marseille-P2731]